MLDGGRLSTLSKPPSNGRASTRAFSRRETTEGSEFFASDADGAGGAPSATSGGGARATDPASASLGGAKFGDSVPLVPSRKRPDSEGNGDFANNPLTSAGSNGGSDDAAMNVEDVLSRNRLRNAVVAAASFAVAILNYGWQFTHPVTAIDILSSMSASSAPLTAIGNNGKPTVIDFWAPWCENCRYAAPTLQAVEREYGDRANFIMVNADDGKNWPLIQLFGVDAIPHLALLSGEGDVETALIGPTSRSVLEADIDALLATREDCGVKGGEGGVVAAAGAEEQQQPPAVCHDKLPYTMYDAWANRPEGRRINFAER